MSKFEAALKIIEKNHLNSTFEANSFQVTKDASEIHSHISDYFADLCLLHLESNPYDPE